MNHNNSADPENEPKASKPPLLRLAALPSDMGGMLDSISDLFVCLDREWKIVYVNRAVERVARLPREALMGRVLWGLVPALESTNFERELRLAMAKGAPHSFETVFSPADTWHLCQCEPTEKGMAVLLVDISRSKRREQAAQPVVNLGSQMTHWRCGFWDMPLDPDNPLDFPDETYLSAGQKSIIGFSDREFPNSLQAWTDRIFPEDQRRLRLLTEMYFKGEIEDFECEYRVRNKQGWPVWVLCRGNIVRDERGRPTRWTGIHLDISEWMEHSQSRAELAALVDASDAAIMRCSLDGRIQTWNRGAQMIYGYAPGEVVGREYSILLPPERTDGAPEILDQIRQGCRLDNPIERRRVRDGREVFVSQCMSPIYESGVLSGVSIIEHDISDRKKTEEALRESETRFRAIFDQAAVGIARLDFGARLADVNLKVCEMLERDRSELIGLGLKDLAHPEDRGKPDEHIAPLLMGQRDSYTREMRCHTLSGNPLWINIAVSVVRNADGSPDCLLAVMQDITQLKLTESDLKQALSRLSEVNQGLEERIRQRTNNLTRKQVLLRDLITQLTLTEQRERRRLAGDLHDYLPQIIVASKMKLSRLERVVSTDAATAMIREIVGALDDALKYTRTLISNLSPAILYEFGLEAAVQRLVENMGEYDIKAELEENGKPIKLSEEKAIFAYQGVREILHNTAKHSMADKVSVILDWEAEHLVVTIHDNGMGFDPRGGEPLKPGQSKFGLFNIGERLESLGGRFVVESAPGKGALFIMQIPIEDERRGDEAQGEDAGSDAIQANETKPARRRRKGRVRLLVVDDHQMIREGLRSMIDSWEEMEVVGEAMDGEEAVAMALARKPDVILMDVKMPRLNGVEATRGIKKVLPEVVVLGLSTHSDREIAGTMVAAGARAFLEKDIDARELREIIHQSVGGFGPPQ